jgi:hypothetical protein
MKTGTEDARREVKEKTTGELLTDFCGRTTAHGLCSIPHTSSKCSRGLWFTLFLLASAGILHQTFQILRNFFSYPILQEVTMMTQGDVPFPSITVCNIEPLVMARASWLSNDPSSSSYEYQRKKVPLVDALIQKDSSSTEYRKILNRVNSTRGFYENLARNESQFVGHRLKDLVLGCTYAEMDCLDNLEDNFAFIPDGTYYNCFTFSPLKLSPNAIGVGPEVGLSLILFLDTDTMDTDFPGNIDTESTVKQGAGARVVIHGQGSLPSPLIDGFDVLPGHSTSVALSVTQNKRLGTPYTNCSRQERALPMKPAFAYTYPACVMLRAQHFIYDKCGCMTVDLPVPDDLVGQRFCGYYDYDDAKFLQQIKCEPKAYKEFYGSVNEIRRHCMPLCGSYSYDFVLSSSYWPKERYEASFFREYVSSRPDKESLRAYNFLANYSDDPIAMNFARLNVYLKSAEILTRSQQASYQSSDLLSDIGGTLGLWAGLSLITVCEFINLTVRIIASCCIRLKAEK